MVVLVAMIVTGVAVGVMVPVVMLNVIVRRNLGVDVRTKVMSRKRLPCVCVAQHGN
jgi:hypothetical protein